MLGEKEGFTVKIVLYAPNNIRVALSLKSAKILKIIADTKYEAFWNAKIKSFKRKILENMLIKTRGPQVNKTSFNGF